MSAARFKEACRAQYKITVSDEMAQQVVDAYRQANQNIVALWRTCNGVLRSLLRGESGYFGGPNNDLFYYGIREIFNERIPAIKLPDGMWLNYRNLREEQVEQDGELRTVMVYDRMKDRRLSPAYIYGGALTENLIQALAFAIMKRQALKIAKKYPVLFNVHDEFISTAKESEIDEAKDYMEECMKFVPSWVAGCPITCEASVGDNYGDC